MRRRSCNHAGRFPILNHFGVAGPAAENMSSPVAMMIEDFVGSETCVAKLRTIAGRGFTVQAHAGDLPKAAKWGGVSKGNQCVEATMKEYHKRVRVATAWVSSGTVHHVYASRGVHVRRTTRARLARR